MLLRNLMIAGLWSTLSLGQRGERLVPDAPIACESCSAWNQSREPFQIFGNTYYVGVEGLSSVLIASDQGLILLDGALPQSAALIDKNIRTLGFRSEDIRLIVNSHAHFDHAGGLAALQRLSGAIVAASSLGAKAFQQGRATDDDPQFAFESDRFPPVQNVRVVSDGEILKVGRLEIQAHFTPGHTPGGTTWTWKSCAGGRCLNVVYADSLNAVSAPGFRFTGDSSHPPIVETLRESIKKVEQLPCDILISGHPGSSGLFKRLELRNQGKEPDAFVDDQACRVYAAAAAQGLDRRILEEK